MLPPLGPQESAVRFSFAADGCLYRDHLGRRVLADVEGFGRYRVERAAMALGIEPCGAFREELVVATSVPGEASIAVQVGREAPVEGAGTWIEIPHEGAGWVLECEGEFEADGRHSPAPTPSADLCVPFFRGLEGQGRCRVVASSTRCRRLDGFSIADEAAQAERKFKVQNISKLSLLDSTFSDGTPRRAEVASHLNASRWRTQVPEGCVGLIVRKVYDRFHGRQRARVLVDGAFAGWWYEPAEDRVRRWAVSDFGISGELVSAKPFVEITIDPPAGSPLWSVSEIELFGLF